jgi:hypothetical protein
VASVDEADGELPVPIWPLVDAGLVLEQRQHGVRPVRDVVEPLAVANSHEADSQGVELLRRELVGRRRLLSRVRLRPSDGREADEALASAGRVGKLVEQLVDARAALRCQCRDRLRQILAVVIRGRRSFPS